MNKKYLLLALILASLALEFVPQSAEAIPAFARRYKLSCTTCHVAIPRLNDFGEMFAGNGYQMPGDDFADQSIDTGDEKLLLMDRVPLAIRVDSFYRTRTDTNVKADLQTPFAIKLLSSAPIKKNISYYFYFFFNERGNVSGVEDAFIYFNDGYEGVDLDLRIGQFQVTDVLFAREQRLTFQDFTYYVTAVSDSNFRLTYDRIIEVKYNFDVTDNLGMGIVAAVADGNGIGTADNDRNFDSDNFKNYYGKVSFDYEGQSVGMYGYKGKENNGSGVDNDFFRIGPDFSFTFFDDWDVWGNYLYGKDSNPQFVSNNTTDVVSWGFFAGITHPFSEDWILSLLYNKVKVSGRQDLNADTITANISYMLMRNFKLMLEFTGDIEDINAGHPVEEHTGVFGIVLAF
jgi:hypothetical protein